MLRRTPMLAIILAPVALYLLVLLWTEALVPLYRYVWYSDTVLQRRLNSEEPAIRIAATKDVASTRFVDAELIHELVARLQTDESAGVRNAAATALGQRGSYQPLTARAISALSTLVLSEEDDASLSAVIVAVGQSAANNRYSDQVIGRIAGIFSEKHLAWLYPRAATTLGQIGAAQPLPNTVVALMNSLFLDPVRPGEREYLADAFTEIAKGRLLPFSTLEILAAAFEAESNRRIRIAILFALAHMAAEYPPTTDVLTGAAGDPDGDIVRAAEHGLRIVEANRIFANTDPLTLAMNKASPAKERLMALRVIRASTIDPAAFEPIVSLAQDPTAEVAVAALDMFRHLARDPDDDFDQRVLIPALSGAMSDPDPLVRHAAYGALSTISIHRFDYLHAADFPAKLDAGANDPDAKVRVVVLLAMIRAASGMSRRDAIIERGMTDPDPYVRRLAAGWLGSARTS